jgi:SAM-dependent methyltransferase
VARPLYDDEPFFEEYSTLPRSINGLAAAPEWPTLRELLPSLTGARVVDLGCGFGWFCRWAADEGAAEVLGIDVSERMLGRARAEAPSPRISYERHDLEGLELPADRFDLAYSSLTLHYLADIVPLFATVRRALTPGGSFVFSIEHPIHTAPRRPGFVTDDGGSVTWPLDQYVDEGPRATEWLGAEVTKHHRTTGTYVNELIAAGFRVRAVVDWSPSPEQVRAEPGWAPERARPPFLLVAATAS